jgi:hypothetical protein
MSKWIKITDREKPNNDEIILINVNLKCSNSRDFIISACYIHENLFYVDGIQYETKYITHWRKMPKGPKL